MYAVLSGGVLLALCDKPRYVKTNEGSGAYVEAEAEEASGISVNGTLYNLPGGAAIAGAPEAVVSEVESGELIFQTAAQIQTVEETSGIAFVLMAEAGNIDDTTAGEHAELFAAWTYPTAYAVGNIRRHGEKLYRCLEAHTSQETWTPDVSPSLWVAISDPAEAWPAWSQPIGATDAYMEGAQVSHKEKHWTSDVDNNVWEPGVYGWTEAAAPDAAAETGEAPEDETAETGVAE